MTISRRSLLIGAASFAATSFHSGEAAFANPKQTDEINKAITGSRNYAENALRNQPVGFDRLWIRRPTGEEIISIYRDATQGLAVIPQQCLMLSYFWRDINDRGEAVTISLGLFDLVSRTQVALSTMAGKPIPIIMTSGFRTRAHNNKIEGAAPLSEHVVGRAIDFAVDGVEPSVVAQAGRQLGAAGVGQYKGFTHLDVGRYRKSWKGKA